MDKHSNRDGIGGSKIAVGSDRSHWTRGNSEERGCFRHRPSSVVIRPRLEPAARDALTQRDCQCCVSRSQRARSRESSAETTLTLTRQPARLDRRGIAPRRSRRRVFSRDPNSDRSSIRFGKNARDFHIRRRTEGRQFMS